MSDPPFPDSVRADRVRDGYYAYCDRLGCGYLWRTDSAAEAAEIAWRHDAMHATLCSHETAVSVDAGGEIVAALCPACDLRLPAKWLNCDHDITVEIDEHDVDLPYRRICHGCGVIFRPERRSPELRQDRRV